MGHVSVTMLIWGSFVTLKRIHDTAYLCTKVDDSRFSRSMRFDWAPKLKMGYVILTMPISKLLV